MTRSRLAWWLLTVLVIVRAAWLSDDALITLRTLLNATNGYGLTFNVAERVQTFTHPLWLGVLWVAHLLFGNVFYAAFAAGITMAAVGLWLVLRVASSGWPLALAGVAAVSSRAFVDYSTSGLENPLTTVVVLVTLLWAAGQRRDLPWLTGVWCGVGLAWLTRPDAVLLLLPVAVWASRASGWRRALTAVAAGLLPATGWAVFAVAYYGFLLPNTYYAKLAAGIPLDERLGQGLLYLLDSLDRDPVTLIVIGLALLFWRRGAAVPRLAMAGVSLYVAYVVWIGGDFMSGRFLAVPFAISLWTLAGQSWTASREAMAVTAVVLLAAAASPAPPLRSDRTFARTEPTPSGIVDERAVHFSRWGLVGADRSSFAEPTWPRGLPRSIPEHVLDTCGLMGAAGLEWGPGTYLLDECALADPLLARLPAVWNDRWRPGHFRRMIPVGYRESLLSNANHLVSPDLAAFYDGLREVVRSESLWSADRFRTIGRFARGRFEGRLDRRYYRHGGEVVDLAALAVVKDSGAPVEGSDVRRFSAQLAINVGPVGPVEAVDLSVDADDRYRLVFLRQGRSIADLVIEPLSRDKRPAGLARHRVTLPDRARAGFDTIVVVVDAGDERRAVGHVRLVTGSP